MAAILFCIAIICWISVIFDIAIQMWQTFPIKEEKSVPIYITKELYNDCITEKITDELF